VKSEPGEFKRELRATWLGEVQYGPALELQRSVMARRKSGSIPDSLLLLEHPHVVTLGRRADETHLVTDRAGLEAAGVEIYETDRGGEATYHGPGQLVGYPIIDVRAAGLGPVTYVRALEETIIQTLSDYGVDAHVVDGETGVWVGGIPGEKRDPDKNPAGKKIAAIGVRISGGVTMHGLALNVSTDLSYFQHIIPCGMPDLPFTSVELETGSAIDVSDCAAVISEKLAANLERSLTWADAELLNG
jgi:lipoyl(octanoyl) transferase